jgi:hypothetical protein
MENRSKSLMCLTQDKGAFRYYWLNTGEKTQFMFSVGTHMPTESFLQRKKEEGFSAECVSFTVKKVPGV